MVKKCSVCGKKATTTSWRVLNRNSENPSLYPDPLCEICSFKETYSHSEDRLIFHLKSFVERLEKYGKLDEDEINFLKIVKKEMPEIVKEFPTLFEEL